MAIKLFGFTLSRNAKEDVPEERLQAFSIPDSDDAALVVDGPSAIGGAMEHILI